MKQIQAKLQKKTTNESTELKKVQVRFIIEKAQFYASCSEVEQVVDEACQHIYENTEELTSIDKDKRLGEVIVQL